MLHSSIIHSGRDEKQKIKTLAIRANCWSLLVLGSRTSFPTPLFYEKCLHFKLPIIHAIGLHFYRALLSILIDARCCRHSFVRLALSNFFLCILSNLLMKIPVHHLAMGFYLLLLWLVMIITKLGKVNTESNRASKL